MDHMTERAQPRLVLAPAPGVPEIRLHQASDQVGLWDGGYRSDTPPPFWAFAWPGGSALARWLLDHPGEVRGRRVVDAGAGGGLASIAAAKAGAASVTAIDPDPEAVAAIARNAAENQVNLDVVRGDAFDGTLVTAPGDLLVAGDMFYTRAMADKVMPVLRRAGARVLVGDPGRGFLPARRFAALASYDVPTRTVVEGTEIRQTTVWELITTGERQ